MSKSTLKIFAFAISLAALAISIPTPLKSQPAFRIRERICQMKKMKVLDVLDLSEEEADKFIVKYNYWEKKLQAQNDSVDAATERLRQALDKGASKKETDKLCTEVFKAIKKRHSLMEKKLVEMKKILDPKNFAKLLIFENRFPKELGRIMMMRRWHRNGRP